MINECLNNNDHREFFCTTITYLLDRSMIARLEGLFIRDLLANDISAWTRVIIILKNQKKEARIKEMKMTSNENHAPWLKTVFEKIK